MGTVSGAPWLVYQFLSDGTRWRGAVWNAGPDAVEAMQVVLPDGMPQVAQAMQLDAAGRRLPAQWRAGKLTLAQPLHQWESVVLIPAA